MMTYGADGGMPFFLRIEDFLSARLSSWRGNALDLPRGTQGSGIQRKGEVNFGNTCRSLMALDLIISVFHLGPRREGNVALVAIALASE